MQRIWTRDVNGDKVHATSVQNRQHFNFKWNGTPIPTDALQQLNPINPTNKNLENLLAGRDSKRKKLLIKFMASNSHFQGIDYNL